MANCSAVARMVGAKEYQPTPNGRVFMWAYYAGDPTNREGWIGKIGDYAYLATPTDNGLSLVAAKGMNLAETGIGFAGVAVQFECGLITPSGLINFHLAEIP